MGDAVHERLAAPYCEVMAALAGDLPLVPWARQWHRPGPDVLPGWRSAIGPDPLEELRYRVLRTVCAEHREHDWRAVRIGDLTAGSGDGTLVRVPDTDANREAFGSGGTPDDSAPYPQLRVLLLPDASTRAVLGIAAGLAWPVEPAATQARQPGHQHAPGPGPRTVTNSASGTSSGRSFETS